MFATTNLRILAHGRINGSSSFLSRTVKCRSPFPNGLSANWLLSWTAENPVSTTELTVYQTLVPEFDNRGVKLIVLAPNTTEAHNEWIKEIQGITPKDIIIPFIADPEKTIAHKFDM